MRKGVKWAGLFTLVLMAAAWIVSLWWTVAWKAERYSFYLIVQGAVGVQRWPGGTPRSGVEDLGLHAWRGSVGWSDFRWWPRAEKPRFSQAMLPLWVPLIVVAVPTGLVWRADRRAARRERKGECLTCGYDRRGLAPDAGCPECGTVASK